MSNGDDATARFAVVYNEHAVALMGYALRRTHSVEDAVDVVAEVFTTAWRRIAEMPSGSSTRPWLFGVARNVLLNDRRSSRRRRALVERLHNAVVVATPDLQETTTETIVVQRALAQLSPEDQELITLTCWEGLSPTEIAIALHMPAGTVRSRLHRARQSLKATLTSQAPNASKTRHETETTR